MKEHNLAECVQNLAKALKEDKSYYFAWQSTIAVAFEDEYNDDEDIRTISNNAAKRFLNTLINTTPME